MPRDQPSGGARVFLKVIKLALPMPSEKICVGINPISTFIQLILFSTELLSRDK